MTARYDYEPESRHKFDEMLKDARGAQEPEHLKAYTMCWLLDMSYPRRDIMAMLNIVEREKGWKR